MSLVIVRPNPKLSSGMFNFSYDYHNQLEKLAVGEQVVVNGFDNKEDLRKFASLLLIPHSSGIGKNYEYKVNERELIYTTKRID